MTADEASIALALQKLRDGNRRFVDGARHQVDELVGKARRDELVAGQAPFAVVLSCSDSRVPSEIVFDCGLGDLFMVRVAGNVVAPSIVGSVEFAVSMFETPLVVVMGHSQCGAVAATVRAITEEAQAITPNIHDIVERISPAVRELVAANRPPADVMPAAVRANVRASVSHLRHGSVLLEARVAAGKLAVVGAEYSLQTGVVTFYDD